MSLSESIQREADAYPNSSSTYQIITVATMCRWANSAAALEKLVARLREELADEYGAHHDEVQHYIERIVDIAKGGNQDGN